MRPCRQLCHSIAPAAAGRAGLRLSSLAASTAAVRLQVRGLAAAPRTQPLGRESSPAGVVQLLRRPHSSRQAGARSGILNG